MFKLTERQTGVAVSVAYQDLTITVDTSFDTVLRCMEAAQDPYFGPIDRLVLTYYLLVPEHAKYEQRFDLTDIAAVIALAYQAINGDVVSDEETEEIVDFTYDAERIYASFMKDYGLDLIKAQGKLSWAHFMVLFNGLSDDTPIMKAIHYRTCHVPKGSEYAEERKRIIKLKRHYELPSHKKAREAATVAALYDLRNQAK